MVIIYWLSNGVYKWVELFSLGGKLGYQTVKDSSSNWWGLWPLLIFWLDVHENCLRKKQNYKINAEVAKL